MKAAVYERYGPPEVIQIKEVAKPTPKDNELLIRVRASAVTAGDWRMRKADPFLARLYNGLFWPVRVKTLGFDLAGDVEAVGKAVTMFQPGDTVFGSCGFGFGAYAEYRCLPEKAVIAIKPANLSYAEAAVVPYGAIMPLVCLREMGGIQFGQRVLIIGASGSVGTFAVQLARYYGAQVTGVCSTANLELVRSLGADAVIDYTHTDYTTGPQQYDLIFDAVGKSSAAKCKDILAPQGKFVSIEKTDSDERQRTQCLYFLKELLEAGEIRPVIDRCYPLEQIVEAHRYAESGSKHGCIAITVG